MPSLGLKEAKDSSAAPRSSGEGCQGRRCQGQGAARAPPSPSSDPGCLSAPSPARGRFSFDWTSPVGVQDTRRTPAYVSPFRRTKVVPAYVSDVPADVPDVPADVSPSGVRFPVPAYVPDIPAYDFSVRAYVFPFRRTIVIPADDSSGVCLPGSSAKPNHSAIRTPTGRVASVVAQRHARPRNARAQATHARWPAAVTCRPWKGNTSVPLTFL